MYFQYFVIFLFGFLILVNVVFRVVEPVYMVIFNKPLYLYFYLLPKKLKPEQRRILEKEFPFYRRLTDNKKVYFEHRVKIIVSYYSYLGKEELVVTDEMKIMIAGTYAMLTFGMRDYLIDLFKTILIYPSVYYSNLNQEYHKGEFNARMKVVVFSWEDFVIGHKTTNDNINLGLHEFSHVLHLHCLKSNNPSAIIYFDEYKKVINYYNDEKLCKELFASGYFRDYALENQFEFIAVVLEHFFETPQIFKSKFPELFQDVATMINLNGVYN